MIQACTVRVGDDRSVAGLMFSSSEIREPDVNEVRVRILGASINYADYLCVTGGIPFGRQGMIPLSDGAGVVDAIGPGVDQWEVGDQVMARYCPEWDSGSFDPVRSYSGGGISSDGYASQYVVKPASWFTRTPKGYSAVEAATLPCAAVTAWRALFIEAAIKPGDWVLTQGTGGVSIFALQFAKAAGARVIASTSSVAKSQRLKELGADHVIDYKEDAGWGKTVFKLADNRGADAIVDVAGGSSLAQSFDAVRYSGYIGLVGVLDGMSGNIPVANLLLKNARVQGMTVGNREHILGMIDTIETHDVRPIISSRFPLEQLPAAFETFREQSHFGKIAIDL